MWTNKMVRDTKTLMKYIDLWQDIVNNPIPENTRIAVYFGLYEGEECFILDCTKESLDVMEPAVKKWITTKELNHLLRD